MKWRETTSTKRGMGASGFKIAKDSFVTTDSQKWYICKTCKGEILRKKISQEDFIEMVFEHGLVGRSSNLLSNDRAYRTQKSWDVIDSILAQRN